VRPSNCIAVVLLTIYVGVHHRKELPRFIAWALPVAVAFVGYNLATRHRLFSEYYNAGIGMHNPLVSGFAMNLISPSRGLLIYCPIVLFSLAGMVVAWRQRWCFPLAPFLFAIIAIHAVFIARYWPGHSYGPRYFTDIAPLFTFFLIPMVPLLRARSVFAAAFAVAALWSVCINGRGATSAAARDWNVTPVNVDVAQWRVWDWHDPQFVRGLR